MKNPPENDVKEFLRESNAIEDVFDEDSFDQAMNAWDFLYSSGELTSGVILKTHKILMLHQKLYPDEKGYFRKVPVYIGGKAALNALHIREHIEGWVEAMNADSAHPELNWKQLHVDYESIHPFVDGNGRTGRMFMNWYRLKNGLPLLIIKANERGKYYKWFRSS